MKKTVITVILSVLLLLPSCKKEEQTDTTAIPLPPPETAEHGTDWAFSSLDSQIMADDENFAVTGKGFEYRGGYLGVNGDGYFDVAVNYEPGPDESFTFEFDYYAKDNGALRLGFWLYDKDSLYGDGTGGEWIKFSAGKLDFDGKTYVLPKDKAVRVRLCAAKDGFTLYADGESVIVSDHGVKNGGGAIKLRSDKSPVYIKNLAFRLGI